MLKAVTPSTLGHRRRRDPLDEAGSSARIERGLEHDAILRNRDSQGLCDVIHESCWVGGQHG